MGRTSVLHICLACFYYDKMSYQENMLVKKHIEAGYEVNVISFCDDMINGHKVSREPGLYIGQFGEPIYRLKKNTINGIKRLNIFERFSNYHSGLPKLLNNIKPDIIFVHGPQTKNVYEIIKYKKEHPDVSVYADNHTDTINSYRGSNTIKFVLKNIVYGKYARALSKIADRFWGTTPARCNFLVRYYHVKKELVDFLPTGVDEKKITEAGKKEGSALLARKGINVKKTFVVISGGKFDRYKDPLPLIEAFNDISKKHKDVSLVLFGVFDKKYVPFIKGTNIKFLGWLDGTSIINLFLNADLSVFVGGHSTMWEETIALGIPGIFRKYNGFQHINFNNNVLFIEKNTKKEIYNALDFLLSDKDAYYEIKKNALNEGRKQFYYSEIARKAIS